MILRDDKDKACISLNANYILMVNDVIVGSYFRLYSDSSAVTSEDRYNLRSIDSIETI